MTPNTVVWGHPYHLPPLQEANSLTEVYEGLGNVLA